MHNCLDFMWGSQTRSWRATVLQSLAPTLIKHTYLCASSDPEDLN